MTIRVFEREGQVGRIVSALSQPVISGRLAQSPDGRQIFSMYNTGIPPENTIPLGAQGKGVLKMAVEIPLSWFED